MKIRDNENLAKHTSIRIGGIAKKFYEPESENELVELVQSLDNQEIYFLSGGSNVLINDAKEFPHVVSLKYFNNNITQTETETTIVGSSVHIRDLINYANNLNYGGIEYLYSLPALVGGCVAMNAGRGKSLGQSISDYVSRVKVLNLTDKKVLYLSKNECEFKYRSSLFRNQSFIVLETEFLFDKKNQEIGVSQRNQRMLDVKKTQDFSGFSFGSVYKEYDKIILNIVKRLSITRNRKVYFSKKTTNWLINKGNGTFKEAHTLINRVVKIHRLFRRNIKFEVVIWE